MTIFAVTYRYSDDVATTEQPPAGLHALLGRLYAQVRRLCPSWEEWQAGVELHPAAWQEPAYGRNRASPLGARVRRADEAHQQLAQRGRIVVGQRGEQPTVGGGDRVLACGEETVAGVGEVQLGGAAAAGRAAAFDGPERFELTQGGLHALHGDVGAAGEFAVGPAGVPSEVPERGQVPEREAVDDQVLLDLGAQPSAQHRDQ
jgi:hypothetical protein